MATFNEFFVFASFPNTPKPVVIQKNHYLDEAACIDERHSIGLELKLTILPDVDAASSSAFVDGSGAFVALN